MIYVEMLGRMGNQMFSYAHARYIQEKYPEQKIAADFTNFKREDDTWINYLQYLNCSGNIEESQRKMNIAQKAMLWLFFRVRKKWNGYQDIYMHEKKWAKICEQFDLYIFTNGYFPFQYKYHFKNKLLLGFFESDQYFFPIRSILQEEFKVKDFDKNSFAVALEKGIIPERSICVGVRKGDFTSANNRGYCDICSPNYYRGG